MDATELLITDHRMFKRLLAELESTTERGVKTRDELFTRLKGKLTVHEVIEEEIFYPALREHPRAKEIVLEAYEEHNVVDTIMRELAGTPYDHETWGAKFAVLKENLEHHIEEEENDLFKKARQVFDSTELDELGRVMAGRRAEAIADASITAN